jgi:hypothetical protein
VGGEEEEEEEEERYSCTMFVLLDASKLSF